MWQEHFALPINGGLCRRMSAGTWAKSKARNASGKAALPLADRGVMLYQARVAG
jgi:hypothetical protein